MTTVDDLRGHIQQWDQGAWCLAALVITLAAERDGAQARAARHVLDALELSVGTTALPSELRGQLGAQATAPLLQIAALLTDERAWMHQSDAALLAQGRASAQAAGLFERFILARLDGLAERLAAPGSRMLDVGTGTGALAAAYAQTFPQLRVVGIDVLPRVLDLAAVTLAESPAGTRVELREQDVATLTDEHTYDLTWVPAPFVPETALREGMPRVAAATKRGGWMMLGHGKFGDDALENALNSFKTVAFGGTPLNDAAAQALLRSAGAIEVSTLATPPGAPALTVGRIRS